VKFPLGSFDLLVFTSLALHLIVVIQSQTSPGLSSIIYVQFGSVYDVLFLNFK